MEKIMALGEHDFVLGFQLSGIIEAYPCKKEDAEGILASLLEKKDAGIIILQDEYTEKLSWKMKKKISEISKPVVITLGYKTTTSTESLQQMIKRAIGVSLEK